MAASLNARFSVPRRQLHANEGDSDLQGKCKGGGLIA